MVGCLSRGGGGEVGGGACEADVVVVSRREWVGTGRGAERGH